MVELSVCDRLRICMWSCFGDESRQGGSFGDEEVFWLGESVEKDRLVLGGGLSGAEPRVLEFSNYHTH